MTVLLLKGYNNYFNRIHKQESSITEYKTASTSYLEYPNVNFDMQDGISTSLIVGSEGQLDNGEILKFDDLGAPDYLIVHDNTDINSRWFVVESVKIRGGQYKLALKRDVLSDFNSQIMNSPCFVEKGSLNDVNDPLILNSEGMQFNQQKQGEDLLRDDTNCAWLVGYLKKDIDTAQTVSYTFPANVPEAVELDSFEWANCVDLYNADGTSVGALKKAVTYNPASSTAAMRIWYRDNKNFIEYNVRSVYSLTNQVISIAGTRSHSDWNGLTSTALQIRPNISYVAAPKIGQEIFNKTISDSVTYEMYQRLIQNSKYAIEQGNNLTVVTEDLTKYNNKLVIKDNKVYRLQVGAGSIVNYDKFFTGQDTIANDYFNAVAGEFTAYDKTYTVVRNPDNPTKKKIKFTLNYNEYAITATEEPVGQTVTYTLPVAASRNTCSDATYDMFCMPISPSALGLDVAETNAVIENTSGEDPEYVFLDTNSVNQLAIAMQLATKLGAGTQAGTIYDLQILPYCPMDLKPEINNTYYGPTYGKTVIDVTNLDAKDYTIIRNNNNEACGVVFYPKKANFSTIVNFTSPNESVHYEWVTIKNPVLKAQGNLSGVPEYWFANFPYQVTDGVWDINENDNLILEDGLTKDECAYISLTVSSGLKTPALLMASTEFPTPPSGQEYSYTFTGNFTIKVLAHWIMDDDVLDKKVKNECDFYRLTSPNYNSFYEFKKTKLKDGITRMHIICTYKPYSPYIKINPELDQSLYSIKDYNDNIGLMLAGDYSIPMISDPMINYELQNRNYQAIFNRQVQNLDVNQRIAKEQQEFQGIVGAITGGVGGAGAGALAGAKAGPWGAVAGAAVGATLGTAGGIAGYMLDKEWLAQQQYEARDFAVDQFQYQLGNIQALPQSMTKSTPLSYNDKVWPILEYFSCTDREKEVLRNKIKYNGMTIMAIGSLVDYSAAGSYLKGQMIRLNDLNDDSHIANAIYEEVNKGFYEGE